MKQHKKNMKIKNTKDNKGMNVVMPLTKKNNHKNNKTIKVKIPQSLNEPKKKIVVFDLDETLGSFFEFSIIWACFSKIHTSEPLFFATLDLFPELFRPGIFSVLQWLKRNKKCFKLVLYTNNIGPKAWVDSLLRYLEYKIHSHEIFKKTKPFTPQPLFDNVLYGFMIDSKRTTFEKSWDDLCYCLGLEPDSIECCFVDDLIHEKMMTPHVMYIHMQPYTNPLTWKEMMERILGKSVFYQTLPGFQQINLFLSLNDNSPQDISKTKAEYKKEMKITQELFQNICRFFKL